MFEVLGADRYSINVQKIDDKLYNMENRFTSDRIINGKRRRVIVDETGNIVNRNPNKDELKGLDKFPEKDGRSNPIPKYTKEQLINELRRFEKEYRRPPTAEDFTNNPGYPSYVTYFRRFGSWSDALKLAGLDVESMVKNGILATNDQKARLAETIINEHFKTHPVDLAGENKNSPCDGICPNGKIYDVKSSGLCRGRYHFCTNNKYKDELEIYYFLAFNSDYTKLEYAWRVPGEIIEKNDFYVGLNPDYEFTVENMKEYDITIKFKDIIRVSEPKEKKD